MSRTFYTQQQPLTERDAYETLMEWAGADWQRKMAVDNAIDALESKIKSLGKMGAAQIICRLIERKHYQRKGTSHE